MQHKVIQKEIAKVQCYHATPSILTYVATNIERATTLSDGLPEKGSTRTRSCTLRRNNNRNKRKGRNTRQNETTGNQLK